MLTMNPISMTAATARGAMYSDRLSHSSRRIDQNIGCGAAVTAAATARGSGEDSGMTFDGVFIRCRGDVTQGHGCREEAGLRETPPHLRGPRPGRERAPLRGR